MTRHKQIFSVADIDLPALVFEKQKATGYTPSPDSWEDETLYFLLVDRFSDGKENVAHGVSNTQGPGSRPLYDPDVHTGNATRSEQLAAEWRESGDRFTGGNLAGLTQKIGYLQRLGITTIWVSPVLKQAPFATHDYHGYGTQNFYEIEPRFGTREDLQVLVRTAHEYGIKVILDIILNHSCDAFAYEGDEYPQWTGAQYPVKGFRDRSGKPILAFEPQQGTKNINGAVWPRELQAPENFSRKGQMVNWDNWPEYEEGDFFGFKDFNLGDFPADGSGTFQASPALIALTEVYKYWIAFADLDGFRIDTVKHMGPGPASWFAREIKAFTNSLGKHNFLLAGEIAGGRAHAHWMLDESGLDTALGIDDIPERMRAVARGEASAFDYFGMFVNSKAELAESSAPNWWRSRVITFFDDHDQVGREVKARFASLWPAGKSDARTKGLLRAIGLNVTTIGIPCLYYGTEQAFDGHGQSATDGDRFIRESMHGAEFGAFGSQGAHFFAEDSPLFQAISRLLVLRKEHPALRRGRQFARPISVDGRQFYEPERMGEPYRGAVAWSRVFEKDEFVCALNTDEASPQKVWVTLDFNLHSDKLKSFECVFSTDPGQVGERTTLPRRKNGVAVEITIPPGGFVIYR